MSALTISAAKKRRNKSIRVLPISWPSLDLFAHFHHRLRMSQYVGSRSFSGLSMFIQNKYIVYEFPQQACAPDFVPQHCPHARRLGRCPRRPIERDCRKMALSRYACAGKAEGRAESVGISSFQQSERGAIPTLILTKGLASPNPARIGGKSPTGCAQRQGERRERRNAACPVRDKSVTVSLLGGIRAARAARYR